MSLQNLGLLETKRDNYQPSYNVAFMHSRFEQEYDDAYIMDLARSLEKFGHRVTIYTSAFSEEDNESPENLEIVQVGSWIPNHIFGVFKRTLARFRAIWMSLKLIFFSQLPPPDLVVLDLDPIALIILYRFRKFKTVYVHHFPEIRASEFFHCAMHVTPDLITAKALNYADDIIVQTKGLLDVFRRTYRKVVIDPIVLLPCYDTGLWEEEPIDVRRIVPDLPKDYILFVTFGEYKNRTNLRLIFDTLEHLFSFAENPLKQKIHFVIAGECDEDSLSQRLYYFDLIQKVKDKSYASQVTFLKQMPIVCQKTLIQACTAVVHPTRHDLYPGPILAAMRWAKPVITVNCGFPADVMMHRLTGILVEPDPYKFAKCMLKLASSKTLQRFLGDMSYSHFCASYSFDRLAVKFNNLILKVLDSDYDLLR